MVDQTPTERRSNESGWYDASIALLAGIAVLGTMVYFVALFRPAGLTPPPTEAIPLFVFNTTAAVISYALLRRHASAGYAAGVGTGALIVVSIGLIATGMVGALPSGGNPLGPIVYAGLGVVVATTSVIAWRKRARAEPTGASSTPT